MYHPRYLKIFLAGGDGRSLFSQNLFVFRLKFNRIYRQASHNAYCATLIRRYVEPIGGFDYAQSHNLHIAA